MEGVIKIVEYGRNVVYYIKLGYWFIILVISEIEKSSLAENLGK